MLISYVLIKTKTFIFSTNIFQGDFFVLFAVSNTVHETNLGYKSMSRITNTILSPSIPNPQYKKYLNGRLTLTLIIPSHPSRCESWNDYPNLSTSLWETNHFLFGTNISLRGTNISLWGTNNFLRETNNFLWETNNFLRETNNFLRETNNFLREINNFLRETNNFLRETNNFLRETNNFLWEANNFLWEANNFLWGTNTASERTRKSPIQVFAGSTATELFIL